METLAQSFERIAGLAVLEVSLLCGLSIIVVLFFAVLAGLFRWIARRKHALWLMQQGIFAGLPFAIIGMTAGYMTASSRIGAIGALVPAALTLVGGVGVFLLTKGGKGAVFSAFAVINFAAMMLLGAEIGGRERSSPCQFKIP